LLKTYGGVGTSAPSCFEEKFYNRHHHELLTDQIRGSDNLKIAFITDSDPVNRMVIGKIAERFPAAVMYVVDWSGAKPKRSIFANESKSQPMTKATNK